MLLNNFGDWYCSIDSSAMVHAKTKLKADILEQVQEEIRILNHVQQTPAKCYEALQGLVWNEAVLKEFETVLFRPMWSPKQCEMVCKAKEANKLHHKVVVLDPENVHRVSKAFDYILAGNSSDSWQANEDGFAYVLDTSDKHYYLIWRSDKEKEARHAAHIKKPISQIVGDD